MKLVKDIIKNVREDRDLKQKDIAAILGVNQQYYSKYETGEYEIPTRHIVTLCKHYNLSADYLLGLIDYEIPIGNIENQDVNVKNLSKIIESLNYKNKLSVKEYIDLIKTKEISKQK